MIAEIIDFNLRKQIMKLKWTCGTMECDACGHSFMTIFPCSGKDDIFPCAKCKKHEARVRIFCTEELDFDEAKALVKSLLKEANEK